MPRSFVRLGSFIFPTMAAFLLVCGFATGTRADDSDDLGLKVPQGFTITRFADDALAHDIYSMTTDTAGRIVVSGPGYIKILIDTDGDGKADKAKDFADGPKSGAQGLYFLGRDLLCSGDAGLIRYKDENGDDKADGEPETFLKIKTGGEHHAHAIRRGPDGWWYVIAGNFADVSAGYITEKTSPVKHPAGGVIMRLKPDLSGGEILCDGFRNAYDFDFDAQGDLFAHDSDGESSLSLPWYLPTRLFHVVPGGEHGWITENVKRPDYYLDAAPVVASTGRGSPTGIVCYRHSQFPQQYRGGMFIEDWTFGRVLFVPLKKSGATYIGQPAEFITTKGETGFAPTDIDVGIDGSLYVCVGGRGTQGAVYRVTYTGSKTTTPKPAILAIADTSTTEQKLTACLECPQPQSSWARARWVPLARKLGAQAFLSVALDEQQTAPRRVRAIEILTDQFSGLPAGTAAEILATARSPELRGTAAWSLGLKPPQGLSAEVLVPYLTDSDPFVRRRALETVIRLPNDPQPLLPSLAKCLGDEDLRVRQAAARIVPRLKATQFKELGDVARKISWRAALTTALGYVWRTQSQNQTFNAYAVDLGRRVLDGNHPKELKLEAARLIQLAVGDMGGDEKTAAMFESYVPNENLSSHERELDPVLIAIAKIFPTGDRLLDIELARTAALLTPLNEALHNSLLARVAPDSHPTDDIHYLNCCARFGIIPGQEQREQIARALLLIDKKIEARNLPTDSGWNERIGELYTELATRDVDLPGAIIASAEFGRPGHVLFMSRLTEKQLPEAVAKFTKAVKTDKDFPWNNDTVFVIGFGKTPEHYDLIRKQYEKFELRMAILMVLAEKADAQDREKFADGLDFGPIEVVTVCVTALEKLPEAKNGVELAALVKLLRRLGTEKTEFALRERVVKLLERNTGEKFDFVFGNAGYKPQPESIEKWTAWVTKNHPTEAAEKLGSSGADLEALKDRLAKIDFDKGDLEKGRKLFAARGCAQCHVGGSGLGPDLSGATGRFSRDDLFTAIALPNRDVSPRYQTLLVETKAGKTFTGLVVYESKEGVFLRNGSNQTFRIEGRDVESKRTLPTSIMPEGLLKDLKDEDLADLYTYLKTLVARTAELEKTKEETDSE